MIYVGGVNLLGCPPGRVQDRYANRRERKPGQHERHFGRKARFETNQKRPDQDRLNNTVAVVQPELQHPNYGGQSAKIKTNVRDKVKMAAQRREENDVQEGDFVSSEYKECSTLEEIKKEMESRPCASPPDHLPDWLMSLDMNLDVTSVDIIPPFEMSRPATSLSYSMPVKFAELSEDDYETISLPEYQTQSEAHDLDKVDVIHSTANEKPSSKRSGGTFKRSSYGPRRYQGDKRVMSMQTGGIRSTPMQPSAKKFINQMITYHHMKHHDRKLRKAKPAIDTKMPATFKIALDRKKLIEERLSDSWNASYDTSLPSHRSNASPTSRPSPMFASGSPHKTTSSTLDLTFTASHSDDKSAVQQASTHRTKSTSPKQRASPANPSPVRSRGSPTRSRPTSLVH